AEIESTELRAGDDAGRAQLEQKLEALRARHTIAGRFFVLDEGGRVLLPDPRAPFRQEGELLDDELEEEPPSDAAALSRPPEARHAYERGLELEHGGKHDDAARELARAASSPDASTSVRAWAAARLARLREAAKDLAGAVEAWGQVAQTKERVRDDHGAPIRA